MGACLREGDSAKCEEWIAMGACLRERHSALGLSGHVCDLI